MRYISAGDAEAMSENAILYVGDMLEGLGGIVTWEVAEIRRLCKTHGITEEQAKNFMSKLSSFVQAGLILVGTCEAKEWRKNCQFRFARFF